MIYKFKIFNSLYSNYCDFTFKEIKLDFPIHGLLGMVRVTGGVYRSWSGEGHSRTSSGKQRPFGPGISLYRESSRRAAIIHAPPVAWARDPQELLLSAVLNYKGVATRNCL